MGGVVRSLDLGEGGLESNLCLRHLWQELGWNVLGSRA